MESILKEFFSLYNESLENDNFIKLIISKPRQKSSDLKKITIQVVEIKNENKLKFVFTHKTKDITKNYSSDDSVQEIEKYIKTDFLQANLFTKENDFSLLINKKMKANILRNKPSFKENISNSHNKEKKRFIKSQNNYLKDLGVVNEKWIVRPTMIDKFKQINKYIETLNGIINSSELKDKKVLKIVDMGSGKGYLTFALYDFIVNTLKIECEIIGVDQRPDLVELCNNIAKNNKFTNLSFSEGTIENYQTKKIDILIALHACDTATDDAIFNGISSNASIIITAPCCHKQVRKQLKVENELKEITQFGILEERQAEILTDTIRALVLESQGYKSQVFEFIADAHTHKNVMIVGTKKAKKTDELKYTKKIDDLKHTFGIEYQYLEKKIREKE
jgi:SAM-dependent methyltransferase